MAKTKRKCADYIKGWRAIVKRVNFLLDYDSLAVLNDLKTRTGKSCSQLIRELLASQKPLLENSGYIKSGRKPKNNGV